MIDVYCKENKLKVFRFKDERWLNIDDITNDAPFSKKYTSDFNNLMEFLSDGMKRAITKPKNRINLKKAMFKKFS